MRVCLGGTFDPLHAGHRALLAEAMRDATEILIGITDGDLARRPDRVVASWDERARRVREELRELGYQGPIETHRLPEPLGPSATGDFDQIVVSPETAGTAGRINDVRTGRGLPSLDVRVVPHVQARDLLPVSSTRVHRGDIDGAGDRMVPVRVAVGSTNPVKVGGVESEVARILDLQVESRGLEARSGVAEQPRDDETMRGAQARARAAQEAWPEADYAVGIEAGLCQDPAGTAWFDVQACVVRDILGRETMGWGPAFQYPAWVTRRALAGEMVSSILGPVAGDPRIGGTTGAIGYLTDGLMDRTQLTRVAVLMAFVPRIRGSLYGKGPDGDKGPGPTTQPADAP